MSSRGVIVNNDEIEDKYGNKKIIIDKYKKKTSVNYL